MKYVIITSGQEWNDYCWEGALKKQENIIFKNKLFPRFAYRFWIRKIFRNSLLIDLFWYPWIKRILGISQDDTVLLVYDWGPITLSNRIIRKLKKEYPKLNVSYIFTNIVKITGATTFGLLDNLKQNYDMVFAFDPLDAKKYGFEYSRLIYEPNRPHVLPIKTEYDLFYVGQAKDRYSILIDIFKDAISQGLKCKFFITGVSESDRYEHPDITYNRQLPYSSVLEYINKSRCIVDAIQGGSSGMTIKTSEAVFWGKKLITTNETVVNESYYKPSNILIYHRGCDINQFLQTNFVPYTDKDRYEFSHMRLFQQIENITTKCKCQ